MTTKLTSKTASQPMPLKLKILLPLACCLILANIYYAQSILTDIAASMGMDMATSGIIVTMVQVGYCLGVLFLVPLGDLVENRRLIACMILGAAAALLMAGYSTSVTGFLAATLCIGLFSAAVQVVVPFAVTLAAEHERGKVIGLVVGGAILGMVLARPASSLMTSAVGWRPVYFVAASLMLILGIILPRLLPHKAPSAQGIGYPAILRSMGRLLREVPRLPVRLALMALVFMGFTMFWSTAPIVLQTTLRFSHTDIALFSMAGLITPPCAILAGRLIDRGYAHILIFLGICMIAAAFMVTALFSVYAAAFFLAVFFLDPGVNMTNVAIQQHVLSSIPEARSRLNALCVAFTFGGGAAGSALGPWLFSVFGWHVVALSGAALMLVPFILNLFLYHEKFGDLLHRTGKGHKAVCESGQHV